MKKFSFSLDTVLKYKNQVLDSLQNEHGKAVKQVNEQEEHIHCLQTEYQNCNESFNEKKIVGMTIVEASFYESYFRQMESKIKKEYIKLEKLEHIAEQKRIEMVEAKKETASIEKLKEKKVEQHNKEVAKSEELFIEEFVSHCRTVNG